MMREQTRRFVAGALALAMLVSVFALAPWHAEAQDEATPVASPEPGAATPQPTPNRDLLTVPIAILRSEALSQPSVFGPANGTLNQAPDTLDGFFSGVSMRDFYVRVQFANPVASTEHLFDVGIGFRHVAPDQHWRIIVRSDGSWVLSFAANQVRASGLVDGLNLGAGQVNELELAVVDNTGYLSVNGLYATMLDLSAHNVAGDIWVGSGFFTETIVDGAQTNFASFQIWPLGADAAAPGGTPVATPAGQVSAAVALARLRNQALSQAQLAGPFAGSVVQNIGTLNGFFAGVNARDFYVRVRFQNPYPAYEHLWDVGIAFRHTAPDEHYRLVVRSDGTWLLANGAAPAEFFGPVPGLRTGPGQLNIIEMAVIGTTGYLAINGSFITTLDLSARLDAGDVWVGSGFYSDNAIQGVETLFDSFVVWPLGESIPTATPEASPSAE
ncbi:MAG TPA: hypothetical protein VIL01_14920 [Thermomicrobiales bacterium]